MSAAAWRDVCAVDDILADTGVAALVDNRQAAIFRLRDGRLYAIGNIDPFSGAPVLARGIVGDIDGEVTVASPVYKQHFRLRDGVCVEDESVSVPVWNVKAYGGLVRLKTGQS